MKDEHNVFDIPISGFTGKTNLEEFENPFHDIGPINNMTKGSLKVRLICALDLNNDEIKVKTLNFHGKIHVVDYFKWETNLNNYFEWKPMIKKNKQYYLLILKWRVLHFNGRKEFKAVHIIR